MRALARGDDTSPSVRADRIPGDLDALTRARPVLFVMPHSRQGVTPWPEAWRTYRKQSCGAMNLGLPTCSTYEAAGNGRIGTVLTMPDAADWQRHASQLNASLCSAPTTMGMDALRLLCWCSSAPARTNAAGILGM